MNIASIRDAASLDAALTRIEAIFDAAPGTPEFEELDTLVTLVEEYENATLDIPQPAAMKSASSKISSGLFGSE